MEGLVHSVYGILLSMDLFDDEDKLQFLILIPVTLFFVKFMESFLIRRSRERIMNDIKHRLEIYNLAKGLRGSFDNDDYLYKSILLDAEKFLDRNNFNFTNRIAQSAFSNNFLNICLLLGLVSFMAVLFHDVFIVQKPASAKIYIVVFSIIMISIFLASYLSVLIIKTFKGTINLLKKFTGKDSNNKDDKQYEMFN